MDTITGRPYHHGHLRATLLAEAERTLRDQGIDALSLRDLARQAGVSHAAPRRHFADRQALLDALAETGFARLGEEVSTAIDTAADDFRSRLRAAMTAYAHFVIRDPALVDLMFSVKTSGRSAGSPAASARLFTVVGDLISAGQQAGALPPGDPERLRLLLAAVMQGIAALVTSGRARPSQIDDLICDAVTVLAPGQR